MSQKELEQVEMAVKKADEFMSRVEATRVILKELEKEKEGLLLEMRVAIDEYTKSQPLVARYLSGGAFCTEKKHSLETQNTVAWFAVYSSSVKNTTIPS
jgi:hypothetical protein